MTMTTDAKSASLVETSMADFVAGHPGLRYTFFGGKGGVGKTVMAGMNAVHLAQTGKRTLLASTNPVHSLSGLLGQDVFGKPTAVTGVENLWAFEIDTRDAIERSKREIREKIQWFLKFAEISTKADEFGRLAVVGHQHRVTPRAQPYSSPATRSIMGRPVTSRSSSGTYPMTWLPSVWRICSSSPFCIVIRLRR